MKIITLQKVLNKIDSEIISKNDNNASKLLFNNDDLINPVYKIENEEMIKLKGEIENLNINDITPVEALSILNEIKNKYNI